MAKSQDEFDRTYRAIKKLSPRQRDAFDAVCVNLDAQQDRRVLEKLEEKGLIALTGIQEIPFLGGLNMQVRRYHTPFPTHYVWSVVCSDEMAEEAKKRGMTVDEYEAEMEKEIEQSGSVK